MHAVHFRKERKETTAMTPKALQRVGLSGLSNAELREVAALAIEEIRHREKRRIEEIIARIRAIAAEGRLSVTIEGRGEKRVNAKPGGIQAS
jgi:hypothetical protein